MTTVGPLTQQVIGIEAADRLTTEQANLPVASRFQDPLALNQSRYSTNLGSQRLINTFTESVYSGLLASSVRTNFSISQQCPSGNCTWDNYATLSVQSNVRNATTTLRIADSQEFIQELQDQTSHPPTSTLIPLSDVQMPKQAISLPDATSSFPGITFDYLKAFFNQSGTDSIEYGSTAVASLSVTNLLIFSLQPIPQFMDYGTAVYEGTNFTTSIYANHNFQRVQIYLYELEVNRTLVPERSGNITIQQRTLAAWDCIFNITVQPMRSQSTNGIFTEQAVGAPVLYDGPPCTTDGIAPYTCNMNYAWNSSTYQIDGATVAATSHLMARFFNSTFTYSSTMYYGESKVNGSMQYGLMAGIEMFPTIDQETTAASILYSLAFGKSDGNALTPETHVTPPPLTVDGVMENVARSLTSAMRDFNGDNVAGSTYRSQPVYSVTWPWLSAPLLILVLTALLVAFTATETRRKNLPTWTDSTLATVIHGLDNYDRMGLTKLRTVEELEEACREIKVILNKKDLVLEAV